MMNEPCKRDTCPSVVTADRLATPNLSDNQSRFCSEICYQWEQRWHRIEGRVKRARNPEQRKRFQAELIELAMLAESINSWRLVVDERPQAVKYRNRKAA